MNDIKPCSRCGEAEKFLVYANEGSFFDIPTKSFSIACIKCNLQGPTKKKYSKAVKAWNKQEINDE